MTCKDEYFQEKGHLQLHGEGDTEQGLKAVRVTFLTMSGRLSNFWQWAK